MKRLLDVALSGTLLLGVPAVALAQQPAPVVGPVTPQPPFEQRTTEPGQQPLFSLFGVPVVVSSPVVAPYCACAFRDFGGQPMRSAGALAAQGNGATE